ncbi:MAG: 3-oxoacyl-[acyl-carrier-protein] synthase, partial [Deltaproteobacteria bacterium]|nr:3-oxoacyl-[acyl-carrier-protein] synthase [Deltaproteobacteria bacterium]
SELASTFMRGEMFRTASPDTPPAPGDPVLPPFNADFLRWMLSDGAGAAFLEGAPRPGRTVLRIDWIDPVSYANELETCMYLGAVKDGSGGIRGWRDFGSAEEAVSRNAFLVQQDVELLNREIVTTAVNRALTRVIARRGIAASEVDWFLPHYSSEFFRQPLSDRLAEIGFAIPEDRWFTNLSTRGNTGSASIYIMMEELFHSGRLRTGEKILCMIPESSRFSVAYMQLTVV